MDTTAHPYADTTLDADLIADVLEAVKRTRIGLETLVDDQRDIPNIHRELRHLVGESPTDDVLALPDPAGDLHNIIESLVTDYEAALTRLLALAAAPVDPVREYERLLRAAEESLGRYSVPSAGAADRAIALAKIADRWLSDALIEAHRRRELNTEPTPPTVTRRLDNRLVDVDAVTRYLGDRLVEVLVVVDAKGALYLVSDNEDAPFYVGIPQAEDEDGENIDPNKGRLDREPDGRGLPVFPLVVLGVGHGASYPQP